MAKFRNLRFEEAIDNIEEYIDTHGLKDGDALPPERKMADELMISRGTLRTALEILEQEGIVYRIQGKGNFVSPRRHVINISELNSFSEAERKMGNIPSSRLLMFQCIPAGGIIGEALGISKEEPVFGISRVRMVNGRPVMLENAYIPCRLAPKLDQYDLEKESLYEVLSREYGVDILDQEIEIKLSRAYEKEAECLEINRGDIVFVEKGIARDMDGSAVEYSKSILVARYTEYHTRIDNRSDILVLNDLKLQYLYEKKMGHSAAMDGTGQTEFSNYEELYWNSVRSILGKEKENGRIISFLFEQTDSDELFQTVMPFLDLVFLHCSEPEAGETWVQVIQGETLNTVVVVTEDHYGLWRRDSNGAIPECGTWFESGGLEPEELQQRVTYGLMRQWKNDKILKFVQKKDSV